MSERTVDALSDAREEAERLRVSLGLADRYIDQCPCDPDIYPEQWAAWQAYDADRKSRAPSPQRGDG